MGVGGCGGEGEGGGRVFVAWVGGIVEGWEEREGGLVGGCGGGGVGGGEEVTGGVEFEVFVEVGVAEVALCGCVSGGWGVGSW